MVKRDKEILGYTMRRATEDPSLALGGAKKEGSVITNSPGKIVMIKFKESRCTATRPSSPEIVVGFVMSETEKEVKISTTCQNRGNVVKIERRDIIRIDRLVVADCI